MAKKKKTLSKKHHRANNKLLILLFVFLGFVLFMSYASIDSKKNKTYSQEEIVAALNSSTVIIPDTSLAVTLEDGKGSFSDDLAQGNVLVSEPYLYTKTKNGYDLLAVMTYNTGGSGQFVTVALFQVKNGKAIYRGSYPVGDRIIVSHITKGSGNKASYVVNVNYLDREENAPMAEEPSVEKTVTFTVENHNIVTPNEAE